MKKILLSFLIPVFLFSGTLCAQELLTLDKAIEIALKYNYDILISRNESQILRNDNSPGNAGFLPQVNLTAGGSYSNNQTKQKYSNGQEVNQEGVTSNNLNAGAGLTWTLFDGLKMFATSGKLKELADQGEINVKIEIENTLFAVINSFYDVVRIKQLIKAGSDALAIYEERLKITQTKFDIGSGSKVEVLQTTVDKNKLRSSLLLNKQSLDAAKSNLNLLLARPSDSDFDIQDSMAIDDRYQKEDLIHSVFSRNYSLRSAEKNISIAAYTIKEFESQRLPRIGINASYNYLKTENKAGFSLYNQTLGLSAGFFASWNLFNGFNTNRQVKNARLNYNNAKEQYNYTKNSLNIVLYNAWKNYQNAKEILQLEEENMLLAGENVSIALQRFKLGASGILELKDAQNSFEESATRLITSRYNAKMEEIRLMKLNGDLVK